MSDIRGDGYGSAHDWRRDLTDRFGGEMGTRYFCRTCGACFVHMYNFVPVIFEAMQAYGVAEACGGGLDG